MEGRVRVILKSGAAFEFDAVDLAVGKDWRGHVGRLSWTRPEDWETDLLYLQRHDVAAMIFARPREEQSSESPPSPMG